MSEDPDLTSVDLSAVPGHVGLIMDGNGRWASARDLERTQGHAAGEAALFATIDGGLALGIPWLTAFTFSTENWKRSPEEVEFLMFFNEDLLLRRRDELNAKGVRMHFMGVLDDPRIPEQNKLRMAESAELTAGNDRMNLVLAFNYGGRADITAAVHRVVADVTAGRLAASAIDDDAVAARMGVPGMPDADLIVRTSGEYRISNFMLWQAAYAEYVFTDVLWPDFTAQRLVDAVVEYQRRQRRFGSA
ncbi:MAG: polyprenyl diphosphate synthase [Acidimicrobiia bacterium]|nr:polyprenyl diphosphate synthase [Acidimicrobiia bacterium]